MEWEEGVGERSVGGGSGRRQWEGKCVGVEVGSVEGGSGREKCGRGKWEEGVGSMRGESVNVGEGEVGGGKVGSVGVGCLRKNLPAHPLCVSGIATIFGQLSPHAAVETVPKWLPRPALLDYQCGC